MGGGDCFVLSTVQVTGALRWPRRELGTAQCCRNTCVYPCRKVSKMKTVAAAPAPGRVERQLYRCVVWGRGLCSNGPAWPSRASCQVRVRETGGVPWCAVGCGMSVNQGSSPGNPQKWALNIESRERPWYVTRAPLPAIPNRARGLENCPSTLPRVPSPRQA